MATPSARGAAPERVIGTLGLAAIAVNSMVGAGIFALPANVAQLLGRASLAGYAIAGTAVLLVALCFAEAGSLFEGTGGPYLYARAAFGPFVGFQAGWMLVLSRVAGAAAISNTFAAYLANFLPATAKGIGRALAIAALMAVLTWINYLGVRPGVWLINTLTIGKLVPLIGFCAIGVFFLDWRQVTFEAPAPNASLQQAALLLIFAFGGFEYASVPSEEVRDARRTVPRSLLGAVLMVVVLYVAIQVVAMGTLPNLASTAAPLSASARSFLGPAGAVLLTIGAIFSTSGTTSASILVGPRTLYAMGKEKQLPEVMARLHPRFHTPGVSTLLFSVVTLVVAVAGGFTELAAAAALARIFYYTTTCVAVPVLRKKMPAEAARFRLRGGALIPAIAAASCLVLLAGTTVRQAVMFGAAVGVGTLLYFICAGGRQVVR